MTGASLGYSGYYNGVSLNYVGTGGYWWSSPIRDTNTSHVLSIGNDGLLYPQSAYYKYIGRAVRCLPNPSILLIYYLWVWG